MLGVIGLNEQLKPLDAATLEKQLHTPLMAYPAYL